jgi:hypothetical protein
MKKVVLTGQRFIAGLKQADAERLVPGFAAGAPAR